MSNILIAVAGVLGGGMLFVPTVTGLRVAVTANLPRNTAEGDR
jgi:hypothetical protein